MPLFFGGKVWRAPFGGSLFFVRNEYYQPLMLSRHDVSPEPFYQFFYLIPVIRRNGGNTGID